MEKASMMQSEKDGDVFIFAAYNIGGIRSYGASQERQFFDGIDAGKSVLQLKLTSYANIRSWILVANMVWFLKQTGHIS